ncbi:hypothetical protein [Bradyrhizobium sp. WU425]|uniref:hypothetical protein n=1 Tax=Bradyrhizobium sp. WU425 TaxID=187029 RepID=UPI001E340AF5|nr:hypothetical protein [Bradyrhizobium canariense]UFW71266.1 hypothetical protein BcanWU425_32000 [Bradyrhizobium canariense]
MMHIARYMYSWNSRLNSIMDITIERMLVALSDDNVAAHAASDKATGVADEQHRA